MWWMWVTDLCVCVCDFVVGKILWWEKDGNKEKERETYLSGAFILRKSRRQEKLGVHECCPG